MKYLCDNCEKDLTYSGGCIDHCLKLSDRHYGPSSDFVFDVYIYPLLKEDLFFCGFGCLEKWIEKRKISEIDKIKI
jgi:hypothetical protein